MPGRFFPPLEPRLKHLLGVAGIWFLALVALILLLRYRPVLGAILVWWS